LARTGETGQVLALVLLLGAAVALALLLWIRPPDTPRSAARFLGLGLTVAFLLAPASRAGYLVLPLLIAGFIEAVTRPPHAVPCPGHPDSPATATDDAE